MFSCKRWNSTKFDRLELTVKPLAPSKHEKIILKSMSQNKKNMIPLFWVDLAFEWYEDIMVFRVLIFIYLFFCLELMVRKDTWMSTTSVNIMVNFSKVAFWKSLDRNYVWSYFSIIYEAHWQQRFKRRSAVENFMDMNQHMC